MVAFVNHLMYADDLVALSPSSAGLQQLTAAPCHDVLSSMYGVQHDIKYNTSKISVLVLVYVVESNTLVTLSMIS